MSDDCCPENPTSKRPWYRNPLFLITTFSCLLVFVSYFIPVLETFRHVFFDYLKMMWWAVLLGLLLGGLIDYFIPPEYISKHLASSNKNTVLYAVGLGFLMSACSHGILALAMELHKKGASGPAVISFLLASPWTSLPITFLLIGFFGWKGLLIIAVALVVAIISGFIFQLLDKKNWIEKNKHSVTVSEQFSVREDLKNRFKNYKFSVAQLAGDAQGILKGALSLSNMILWWMVLGILMASLVSAFVPDHWFMKYFGPSFMGLMITIILAAVLEVCSEGTSPLAFEIYKNTGAFGNAFAFLMGGVVTDYTEVGLIWMNLGRRTALWMVAVSVPQVILFAWLMNILM